MRDGVPRVVFSFLQAKGSEVFERGAFTFETEEVFGGMPYWGSGVVLTPLYRRRCSEVQHSRVGLGAELFRDGQQRRLRGLPGSAGLFPADGGFFCLRAWRSRHAQREWRAWVRR